LAAESSTESLFNEFGLLLSNPVTKESVDLNKHFISKISTPLGIWALQTTDKIRKERASMFFIISLFDKVNVEDSS